jgi:hypothetical protein
MVITNPTLIVPMFSYAHSIVDVASVFEILVAIAAHNPSEVLASSKSPQMPVSASGMTVMIK